MVCTQLLQYMLGTIFTYRRIISSIHKVVICCKQKGSILKMVACEYCCTRQVQIHNPYKYVQSKLHCTSLWTCTVVVSANLQLHCKSGSRWLFLKLSSKEAALYLCTFLIINTKVSGVLLQFSEALKLFKALFYTFWNLICGRDAVQ